MIKSIKFVFSHHSRYDYATRKKLHPFFEPHFGSLEVLCSGGVYVWIKRAPKTQIQKGKNSFLCESYSQNYEQRDLIMKLLGVFVLSAAANSNCEFFELTKFLNF